MKTNGSFNVINKFFTSFHCRYEKNSLILLHNEAMIFFVSLATLKLTITATQL